jgi:hypothetical protein
VNPMRAVLRLRVMIVLLRLTAGASIALACSGA